MGIKNKSTIYILSGEYGDMGFVILGHGLSHCCTTPVNVSSRGWNAYDEMLLSIRTRSIDLRAIYLEK